MQIAKWGEDLAVRLPAELVESLGLKEGDEVSLQITPEQTATVGAAMTREQAIELIKNSRWQLPEGYKFDRDKANERR